MLAALYPTVYSPNKGVGDVRNWDRAGNLANLRAGIAAVRAGTGICKIDCYGDSATFAALSAGVNTRSQGYPARLAANLVRRGLFAANQDDFGGLGASATLADYTAAEARGAFGPGWAVTGQGSLGGKFPNASISATGAQTWTPTEPFNEIEIEYFRNSANGKINVDIGGAVLATVNCAGSAAIQRAIVSTGGATATGLVNLKNDGTVGTIFPFYVRTRNTALKAVEVSNFGWSASKSGDWASTALSPYDPQSRIAFRAPHCGILCLAINDANAGTSLATFIANTQALITKIKATGDCILVTPMQSNPATFASLVQQQTYVDALYALADSNNVPLFDLTKHWGTYAQLVTQDGNAAGIYGDDRHPGINGSNIWGDWIASYIARL
ncbi:SGNH/GDSL hydrolase family protein [Brevundimonas sp. TWP2-3-4b1]|uniref:SGNH/GDSL hydrolase family protein n=1 Tax=Brevundimonas sp. TWP2-3-4b1 TaxID=2804580 RepID=UPI003CED258F